MDKEAGTGLGALDHIIRWQNQTEALVAFLTHFSMLASVPQELENCKV
jgi:hypothetical protein